MKVLGILVMACVILAAAQAVAAALAILLIVAIVFGAFVYPRETFGLLGFFLLAGLIERYPLAFLGLAALITIAGLLRKRSG